MCATYFYMFSQSFKRFLSETSTRALYLQRPNFKVISQHWHFTLMYHIWSFSRHYYFCMTFDLEKECLLSPLWRVYKGFFIFQSFSSTLVLSSWWSSIHLLEMEIFLLSYPLVIYQKLHHDMYIDDMNFICAKYYEVSMVGRYFTSLYLPCKW